MISNANKTKAGGRKGLNAKREGFTLIELLIVVAIIAILAAIAVPNFLEAQVRARVARAQSDMRSLAVACQSYITDYNTLPMVRTLTSFTALNYYNVYCARIFTENQNGSAGTYYATALTTPVAYISSIRAMADPFNVDPKTSGNSVKRGGYGAFFLLGALKDKNYVNNGWNMYGPTNYALWPTQQIYVQATPRRVNFLLGSIGPSKDWGGSNLTYLANAGSSPTWNSEAFRYVQMTDFSGTPNGGVEIYDPTNGSRSVGIILRTE